MYKNILLCNLIAFLLMNNTTAQKVIPLYKDSIPNSIPCAIKEVTFENERVSGTTKPSLTIYLPSNQDLSKSCVIICPGGGYQRLAIGHEGYQVAEAFNKMGIAAFVLKYRIPNDTCMVNKEEVPLQDAQQAIKLIRDHAEEWKIDINKIGIMGFSAGGHLASTLITHFKNELIENNSKTSLAPNFAFLIYPVISMNDINAHTGSVKNLLGKNSSIEKANFYSNQIQVNSTTPPTFLVHAADDKAVNVQNSIDFFLALKKYNVPAEMHIYQNGGHGFGLNNKTTKDSWFTKAILWMQSNGWYKGSE